LTPANLSKSRPELKPNLPMNEIGVSSHKTDTENKLLSEIKSWDKFSLFILTAIFGGYEVT
jgi:hypothetical protein